MSNETVDACNKAFAEAGLPREDKALFMLAFAKGVSHACAIMGSYCKTTLELQKIGERHEV